ESKIIPQISFSQGTQHILEVIGSIFAFGIIMYTALLLGASFGRPFWGTPILPYLFLSSGLLTGLAAISLALLSKEEWRKPIPDFLQLFVILLTLEIFLAVLALATVDAPESITALVTGDLSIFFIVGVLIVGIFIPLIVALYSMPKKEVSYNISGLNFVLVLIGGFLLRYVIVVGGQVPPIL
ncbi:MAG: NrfD/PsrC family molybdoenzyme membrane anchor subunit, partial [Candidatus Hodarchaeota archaeon]